MSIILPEQVVDLYVVDTEGVVPATILSAVARACVPTRTLIQGAICIVAVAAPALSE